VADHIEPAGLGDVLAGAAIAMAGGAGLDAVLGRLLEGARSLTGADLAAILGVDGGPPRLVAAAGYPPGSEAAFEAEVADERHPVAVAAREGRATIGRAAGPLATTPTTAVDLPLITEPAGVAPVLGVATFCWMSERAIDPPTEATLRGIAALAALALDRERAASHAAEQAEWHDRLAGLDPLTGLANRRTLDRVLELEIERAKRQQSVVSIAVFDVDRFRSLNELRGTAAGDAVLRAVAALLAEKVRLVDTVARVGGDEFVVVAPGSGGAVVAQRIVAGLAELGPIDGLEVSVSAGVARFPADGLSADELVDAALGALAAAREDGAGMVAEVRAG
jgi:diguanylate cyclase (GGDEF)-like protein